MKKRTILLLASIFLFIFVFLGFLIPTLYRARGTADLAMCQDNVRRLLRLSKEYADRHGGKLPAVIQDLAADARMIPICPASRESVEELQGGKYSVQQYSDYELLEGGKERSSLPSHTAIVREIRKNHGGRRNVGFSDEGVELLPAGQ